MPWPSEWRCSPCTHWINFGFFFVVFLGSELEYRRNRGRKCRIVLRMVESKICWRNGRRGGESLWLVYHGKTKQDIDTAIKIPKNALVWRVVINNSWRNKNLHIQSNNSDFSYIVVVIMTTNTLMTNTMTTKTMKAMTIVSLRMVVNLPLLIFIQLLIKFIRMAYWEISNVNSLRQHYNYYYGCSTVYNYCIDSLILFIMCMVI